MYVCPHSLIICFTKFIHTYFPYISYLTEIYSIVIQLADSNGDAVMQVNQRDYLQNMSSTHDHFIVAIDQGRNSIKAESFDTSSSIDEVNDISLLVLWCEECVFEWGFNVS